MSGALSPGAHDDDSLLSLAREFEQHLDRLARSTAGEQCRGDGLRGRNEQLRDRAGLARAAPARDVEVDAGGVPERKRATVAAVPGPRGAAVRAEPVRKETSFGEVESFAPSESGDPLREPLLGNSRTLGAGGTSSKVEAKWPSKFDDPLVDPFLGNSQTLGASDSPVSSVTVGKVISKRSKSRLQLYAARGSVQRGRLGRRNSADIKAIEHIEAQDEEAKNKKDEPVEYHQSLGTFWRSISLAVRVAFWCAMFGFPMYSQASYALFFGSDQCSPSQFGRWMVGPNGTGIIPHAGVESTPLRQEDDVWCGYLPVVFANYWPNVIQMIIFTVYKTSGTTISQAWDGMLGTWCATVNIYILMTVWPAGAMDAGYIPWVAWLDCLGIVFLFLISKMSTNAIKFGLSWHVYFMMVYMNPNTGPRTGNLPTGIPGVQWDSEPTAVLITTYTGSFLAVLSTLLPFPMLNIARLDEDTKTVVKAVDSIWEEAISYFCGGRRAAKRLQIAGKINKLSSTRGKGNEHWEASWWETFDLCKFKHKRALYAALNAELDNLNHVLLTMRGCILEAHFEPTHERFMDESMGNAVENLKCATLRLLHHIADACRDGIIDDDERQLLIQCAGEVKHCQMLMLLDYEKKLSEAFGQVDSANPFDNTPFTNCTIFVYSLSVFAWRVRDFVETQIEADRSRKRDSIIKRLCGCASSVGDDVEHLNFAIRNTMSISLCFVMGFYLRGSVFQGGYSSTMAGTLALLISRYAGTSFDRNTKRLIGVSLGKILPILIMTVVNLLECNSTSHVLAHVLSICLYITTYEYMYFTSLQWDYVGLCAAAFGCPFFFTKCVQGGAADSEIKANYVEIGQVILAIVVQITVDTVMKSKDTRQIAIVYARDLGQVIQHGFRQYFSGCDLSVCESYLKIMKSSIPPAEEFRPIADPRNAVFPGRQAPFKHLLYGTAIHYMKLIVNDFEMICMCRKASASGKFKLTCWNHERMLDFLAEFPSMEDLEFDFLSFLGLTRRGLDILLHHDNENYITDRELKDLEEVKHLHKLDDMVPLTDQINQKVGRELAHLSTPEPRSATFTIAPPSTGEVREPAGFSLVSGTATIANVLALSPAARSGMSEKHIGWIVTHVNGREVTFARLAHTAEALADVWHAGQTLTLTAHTPVALFADPRARLLVTLKALQSARDHIGHIASICIQENLH